MTTSDAAVMDCLHAIAAMQQDLEGWTGRSRIESDVMYSHMSDTIQRVRSILAMGEKMNPPAKFPQTPPRPVVLSAATQSTPQRTPGGLTTPGGTKQGAPNRSPIMQRDVTVMQRDDDDAWNDITSHIQREAFGNTTPPPGTPDVTPTGSPPCLEKRPTSALFGPGATINGQGTPINFELLFQQLSQDDGMAPPPVRDPANPNSAATDNAWVVSSQPPGQQSALDQPPRTVRPSIAMDTILHFNGQNVMRHLCVQYADHGRPTVVRVEGVEETAMPPPLEGSTPCQVLVEFKRRRVLQYDSPCHIVPGEYAVVAGDRGDDLGLVIFSWYNTPQGVTASGLTGASVGKWIGLGIGKVVRAANPVEVSQVHGIQSELERCAVEVCQQRVREFTLPMVIIDAEYQFDRKKLTFYYEAQQRLDFRELVRDLYRTFRARIWMEMVEDK